MEPGAIAIISGLGALVLWGTTDIFIKKSLNGLSGKASTFYFLVMMFLMGFPLLLIDSTLPELSWKSLIGVLMFGVADLAAIFAFFKAIAIGKVSIINPITGTWVAVAAIVSFLILGEEFNLGKVGIIILILLGILFTSINFYELRNGLQEEDLARGVPYAVIVMLIYGIYIPFFDQLLGLPGWTWLNIGVRLVTLLSMFIYMLYNSRSELWPAQYSKYALLMIVLAGICQGLGANIFNWGLASSDDTALTSALASGYPAVLVVLGYIFLKERLVFNQYLGVSLIVLSVVLLSLL